MNNIKLRTLGLALGVMLASIGVARSASSAELSAAIQRLANHVDQTSVLDANQINQQAAIIQDSIAQVGQTSTAIREALDLVASYETSEGPLFMNDKTRSGIPRKPAGGLELERAIFAIQQGLIDHAYTSDN